MRKHCCLLNTSSGLVDVVTKGLREIIKNQRCNERGKEDDEKVDCAANGNRKGEEWRRAKRRHF